MGARNNPFYRLVVADSRFATTGRSLEELGWYDPKKAEDNFSVKIDRVDYWQSVGAQMSFTAKSLIKKARAGKGVAPGAQVKKVDSQVLLDEEAVTVEKKKEPILEEAAPETPVAETTAPLVEDPSKKATEKAEESPEKQES